MTLSLVTGAAGFLGSHVVTHLLGSGHNVVGLDDMSGGRKENIPSGTDFVAGSICDTEFVDDVFGRYPFDYVFHLAAYAAEGLSHFVRRFNYRNNVVGSINLINAAIRAERIHGFVFTSSIAVYGEAQMPATEQTIPTPSDPYGIAKLAVELDLVAAADMFALPYIIFRPHNVYGPGQNINDPFRNVVGIFMRQALKSEPFSVFGDGNQVRAFSHIDDVAPVIARSIERPEAFNEIFNVGANSPTTVNRLAEVVAGAMGVPLRVEHLPARREVFAAYSDHVKVRTIFGLGDEVDLEAGIHDMAAWVLRSGPGAPTSLPELEVRRNLPPNWLPQYGIIPDEN